MGSDNLPNNAPGRGDPSTAFDANGNGYIATMSYPTGNINAEPNGYAIQRTVNNGTTWGGQVSGSGTINGLDKIMIAADDVPTSPFANNFYCTWTNFNVYNGRIEFNRSTNGGTTFSTPIALNANWGQGANVQTGPNGEIYVCWADYTNNNFPEQGLGFASSTNGGQTFTNATVPFSYVGIRSGAATDANFNNTRVNSFPSMAVDKSNGVHRGRIYVTYSARENGNGRAIIQMRFSDNQGITWSSPSTVSIANGRQNWFPWMALDDTNGYIYITYYSLDEATGFNTNTYVAVSNDAGQSFVNQRVSDVNHVTAPMPEFAGGYIGDYIGITAFGGVAYASWSDNRTGQWQIYVSRVSNNEITGPDNLCSSSVYSINNLPANVSVSWSSVPANVVSFSCTNCGSINFTQKTITCEGSRHYFYGSVEPRPFTTNYAWYAKDESNPNNPFVLYESGPSNAADFPLGNGTNDKYYTIKVIATNACGNKQSIIEEGLIFASSCSGGGGNLRIAASPNPANSIISVEIMDDSKDKLINKKEKIFEIQLLDKMGVTRKQIKYSGGMVKINIALDNVESNIYVLRVFNGKQWISKQIIKKQ